MDIPLSERILYEDNHLIIINKLPGEIVQGDKTQDIPLVEYLKNYLKIKYHKQGNVFCGLVHRIDRPVGGAVIFAKTSKALSRMNVLIQKREIQKTYYALVEGKLVKSEDCLIHYLKKNEKLNKSFAINIPQKGYLKAELSYVVQKEYQRYSLLEVCLKTGRHHQIRVQLSTIGYPIVGDLKYGSKRSNKDGSICLYAHVIAFIHPISLQPIKIEAPILNQAYWKIF